MDTRPVIVGIDGSDNANAALAWAAEFGRRYDVPVHAILVWDIGPVYGVPIEYSDADVADLDERAHRSLDTVVETTLGSGAEVVKDVVRGYPASVLIDAAQAAQLLVVGSRGQSRVSTMLAGSVSRECVNMAMCPVVVVPDPSPHFANS